MTGKFCLIFLTIFALATPFVHAFTLKGVVYGAEGQPLDDVLVIVRDEMRREYGRDYSDRSGEYEISNLPVGTFTLEATKQGMPKVTFSIDSQGIQEGNLYQDIHFAEAVAREGAQRAQLSELYISLDQVIPKSTLNLYNKGVAYMDEGKIDKAVRTFRKLISCEPTFSRAYTGLGIALMKQKKTTEALDNFDAGIKANPKDPIPLIQFCKYYLDLKDIEKAADFIERANQLDPALNEIHLLAGEISYAKGNYADAERELTQGLSINPSHYGEARILLAETYLKLRRPEDARDQYAAYLRENPDADNRQEIKMKLRDLEIRILKE
jgi:tetratricopeptide (TPR) repeat protein